MDKSQEQLELALGVIDGLYGIPYSTNEGENLWIVAQAQMATTHALASISLELRKINERAELEDYRKEMRERVNES